MRISYLLILGLLISSLLLIVMVWPRPPSLKGNEMLLKAKYQACTCADMRVLQGKEALKKNNKGPRNISFDEFYLDNPDIILKHNTYNYDPADTFWLAGNVVGHRRLVEAYGFPKQSKPLLTDEIYPVIKVRAFTYASFRAKGFLGILLGIIALIGLGMIWMIKMPRGNRKLT